MEHFLGQLLQAWIRRGGAPEAQPLNSEEGWVLTLNARAKFTSWVFLPLFAGGLVGVLLMQAMAAWPPRQFWFLLVCYTAFTMLYVYYVCFCYAYRVELTGDELILRRCLIPTRRMCWSEMRAFRYAAGDETIKFESASGEKLGIYASLNGLSAVRRCLAALTPMSSMVESWQSADPALMADVPAWRCDERDLEDNPFAPLGSWQQVTYEEDQLTPDELE